MSSNPSARLTPESKAELRKTIRGLRDVLLHEIREYANQRYLLKLELKQAKGSLSEPMRARRRRLEEALAERAAEEGNTKEARERALEGAVKEASATLLNRLVLIRHLEAVGLSRPAVVTGGWNSPGYQQFRDFAPGLLDDETQGYAVLLQLMFDELATAIPGLFGDVGLTSLFPPSPATLRAVIEALDQVPSEAWRDDMTLGWVYQYWNDPDREALDKKLHERGKLEPHEIASKTQMFTERYMVEWLLHNSLGPTWLAMCQKNGWAADAEKSGVLENLEQRRAEWRKKREAGEVALDALMPVEGPLEEAWKYYVPQPLPDEVVKHAPSSIRELKLLDPACGSGHFLVVAFDLLVELYREEARHRGESWGDKQIAESILENNLHGVDIDPRAVQIAAAALFLKARTLAKDATPKQVNLVAPALRLSALNPKDPSLLKLERDIETETGIPPELTQQIVKVLEGVDHLGTLLKIGDAVDNAIEAYRGTLAKQSPQRELFPGSEPEVRKVLEKEDAKKIILDRLNAFLAHHRSEEDLGLRLRGQQIAAGLRFATIVREGEYHLVVANPPYQDTSDLRAPRTISKLYPRGKADLYGAFLERGFELCRAGGTSAMLTMRSWMFLSGFTALREHLLRSYDLRAIGDVDRGGFDEVANEVLATAMSVFRKLSPAGTSSVAVQPTPLGDKSYDRNRTARKRAALLCQRETYTFRAERFRRIDLWPLVYWWSDQFLEAYEAAPKVGASTPVAIGLQTSNNNRFIRKGWELAPKSLNLSGSPKMFRTWSPSIQGAEGRKWIEPVTDFVDWRLGGLAIQNFWKNGRLASRPQNQHLYFKRGISIPKISGSLSARIHAVPSIFSDASPTVFPTDLASVLCSLNCTKTRVVLESLNPTLNFEVCDLKRAPVESFPAADEIFSKLEAAFAEASERREPSLTFQKPERDHWDYAQQWAQHAVDCSPLPPFEPVYREPSSSEYLSFLVGVALGRFPPPAEIDVDERSAGSMRSGILFLSSRVPLSNSVLNKASLVTTPSSGNIEQSSFEYWLRDGFFEHHRNTYASRPIYFPLSSPKRSFIAYVSIHRWTESTLNMLLAEHLVPERKALEGALVDLQAARTSPDKKARAAAEKGYVQHRKWLEELEEFIGKVQEITEKGPPPPDDNTEPREVDAAYRMDLDDGVMVNSAALWPLLDPMWKDPKKWWKELANAKGRKDYDWSNLARRYFPSRVDEKCRKDPSLAVAHGCFWKYHPEKAFQWELRLQDEIGKDFTLDEADSDERRAAFLKEQPARVQELLAAELARRERKVRKQDQEELELDSSDETEDGGDDEAASA